MLRHEMTQEDATRILAGFVRNHVAAPGIIFTPYHGLDLSIRDGWLVRTNAYASHEQQSYVPIASVEDILTMNDDQIAALFS